MQQTARFSFYALLTLLFSLIIPVSRAQTAVDGAVGGTVTDSSGSIVSGATITVQENATNAEQTVKSDASGYFRAIHLQPGTYSVTVAASGFEPYKSIDLIVQVGLLTTIDAHMQVGSTSQTVESTRAPPLVNTTSPDFAGIIDQKILHDLPVSNYRWSSYALMTPGVVNDSNGYGLLRFRGQSTLLNNVTIDGTDDNQAFFAEERGRTRAGYSTAKESVQEFQVNTSNYSVEYGRSAGGIVNSVTKSGTNDFHGLGYYCDRDIAWAATNSTVTHPVEVSNTPPLFQVVPFKPTDLRRQFGFAVGGPIWKNKIFFFFAADRFYHDFPAAATITGASPNANFYTPADPTLPAGKTCGGTGSAASLLPGRERLPDRDQYRPFLRRIRKQRLRCLQQRYCGAADHAWHGASNRRPDHLFPQDRLASECKESCFGGSKPDALDLSSRHPDQPGRCLRTFKLRQRLRSRQLDRRQTGYLLHLCVDQRSALYVWPRFRIRDQPGAYCL